MTPELPRPPISPPCVNLRTHEPCTSTVTQPRPNHVPQRRFSTGLQGWSPWDPGRIRWKGKLLVCNKGRKKPREIIRMEIGSLKRVILMCRWTEPLVYTHKFSKNCHLLVTSHTTTCLRLVVLVFRLATENRKMLRAAAFLVAYAAVHALNSGDAVR